MSERAPTLAQLRAEARRVFGERAQVASSAVALSVWPGSLESEWLVFHSSRRVSARRFALETLRQLPSKETP